MTLLRKQRYLYKDWGTSVIIEKKKHKLVYVPDLSKLWDILHQYFTQIIKFQQTHNFYGVHNGSVLCIKQHFV